MLVDLWVYFLDKTTVVEKIIFISTFAMGAKAGFDNSPGNPLIWLLFGLVSGLFWVGAWKITKSWFRFD